VDENAPQQWGASHLKALVEAVDTYVEAEAELRAVVEAVREAGYSWADILAPLTRDQRAAVEDLEA
jgi:hypothetical protein